MVDQEPSFYSPLVSDEPASQAANTAAGHGPAATGPRRSRLVAGTAAGLVAVLGVSCLVALAFMQPGAGVRGAANTDDNKNLLWAEDSGNSGMFWQINDIHIDFDYQVGAKESDHCRDKSLNVDGDGDDSSDPTARPTSSAHAGKHGTHDCDTPESSVRATFDFMKSTNAHPDFIVYAGDDARHDKHLSAADLQKSLVSSNLFFLKYFPGVPVYPTVGNHDMAPEDVMADAGESKDWAAYFQMLAKLWSPWLDETALKTVEDGGYYSMLVPGTKLRVVSMATMYFFKDNADYASCSGDSALGSRQMQWLDRTLTAAGEAGETAYLVGHVWPTDKHWKDLCMDMYIDLVTKHGGHIKGQFFGHSNTDELHLIYPDRITHARGEKHAYYKGSGSKPDGHKKADTPVGAFFVNPSVYPKYNPGVRLWKYDRGTTEIHDYKQYYVDLDRANDHDLFAYTLEYTTSATYGVETMSSIPLTIYDRIFNLQGKYLSAYELFETVGYKS